MVPSLQFAKNTEVSGIADVKRPSGGCEKHAGHADGEAPLLLDDQGQGLTVVVAQAPFRTTIAISENTLASFMVCRHELTVQTIFSHAVTAGDTARRRLW